MPAVDIIISICTEYSGHKMIDGTKICREYRPEDVTFEKQWTGPDGSCIVREEYTTLEKIGVYLTDSKSESCIYAVTEPRKLPVLEPKSKPSCILS